MPVNRHAPLAALEEGAAAARAMGNARALLEIARRAVAAAVNSAVGRDIDRALWLVQRGGENDAELEALAEIARSAAEQQRGRSASAWRIATRVTRVGPTGVVRLAWSVREMAARVLGPSHRAAVLKESARWVRSERSKETRTARCTWHAWALYSQGNCAESLRLHRQCLANERNPSLRVRMALDAAAAALDAGRPAAAIEYARWGMATARRLRRPVQEARAWVTLRDACYRRGDRLKPDLIAVDAAASLGFRDLADAIRTKEAVIAWRAGSDAAARSILRPTVIDVDPRAASAIQLLALSLDAAAGAATGAARARVIRNRAVAIAAPGVAMQILALLARGQPRRRAGLAAALSRLRLPVAQGEWRRCREVFALDEAATIIGVRAPR